MSYVFCKSLISNRVKINLFLLQVIFLTGAPAYISEILGDKADVSTHTTQGSVIVGGGGDVSAAFRWMIDKSGGGDFVVIGYGSGTGYNNYIYNLGEVNSVETINFESDDDAHDQTIIDKIRGAEALWIKGGEQSTYVRDWKDTPVEDAINYLINEKKCPVGGTSAGAAVMTPIYWGATTGSWPQNNDSQDSFEDPFQSGRSGMGFNDFIDPPFLHNTISDQHYIQRSRQYRHIAMMAHALSEGYAPIRGIAVNEATAVAIEPDGIAKVFGNNSDSHAFFLHQYCEEPEVYSDGDPLTWLGGFKVYKVLGNDAGDQFLDLNNWTTTDGKGTWEYWYADDGELIMDSSPHSECDNPSGIRGDLIPGSENVILKKFIFSLSGNNIRHLNISDRILRGEILNLRGDVISDMVKTGDTLSWNGKSVDGTDRPAGVYLLRVLTSRGMKYFMFFKY